MARRVCISAAVGAVVALTHGHSVRLGTSQPSDRSVPAASPGGFLPHPSPVEASRSAPLMARPAPEAPTTIPEPVRPASAEPGWTALGVFRATCFDLRGRTASGAEAGPGVVAVDPAVIPLGTHLHIAGYGDAIAADTGSAIHGRRVDVWLPTEAECATWGVRWVAVEEAA